MKNYMIIKLYYKVYIVTDVVASTNGNVATANGSPAETELPTPTSSAPDGNPASLAFRNALQSVFRTDNDARNDNVNRNDQDLPVFDTP